MYLLLQGAMTCQEILSMDELKQKKERPFLFQAILHYIKKSPGRK